MGARFKSVIGFGQAYFVEDVGEKERALNFIMNQYAGKSFEFAGSDIDRVTIIRVDIEQMTAKRAGY